MKKLPIILLLLLLAVPCRAADYYIAQTASGAGNGADCSNADAIADLTWGSGNMVDAGDTLHLCGTITSTLTIGASGSFGSPITIVGETGSKCSKTYWGTASSSAIYANAKHYLIIDGVFIENTANGSSLANQQATNGIYITGSHDTEIKNCSLGNLYVRDVATDYAAGAGNDSIGIVIMASGNNISVHDNTFSFVPFGSVLYFTGTVSGYSFYANTFDDGENFVWAAPYANNSVLTGLSIYNNTANFGDNWSFPSGDHWHSEYVHVHNDGVTGASINEIKIYGNTFGPECPMKTGDGSSSTTAWIFVETAGTDHWIYNNLFIVGDGYDSTNGVVALSGSKEVDDMFIANNTFIKLGATDGIAAINISNNSDTGLIIKNNIIENFDHGIYTPNGLNLTNKNQISNNIYNAVSNWNAFSTWATWTAAGYDINSSNGVDPSLDAEYKLEQESDAIGAGTDLSSYFTTDKDGIERGTTWDIGAYEFEPPPPHYSLQSGNGQLKSGNGQFKTR